MLLLATTANAQKYHLVDTLKGVDIPQIEIYSYKEPVREIPASASVFSPAAIERNGIDSPTRLTGLAPNFYMPAYGSKLTSAIYIRGVGSRMNDPAVGLYVDNIPMLDKSMYNFDLYGLGRIEVLRGPQGTLYGRNAMGGIINIFTPSPVYSKGTSAMLSYGNANTAAAGILHSGALGKRSGFSLGVNYRRSDGFFTNRYDGSAADATESAGARLRADWELGRRWMLSLSAAAEQSNQQGYPYGLVNADGSVADPDYNGEAGYDRTMAVASAYWRYAGHGFTLAGTSSYQYFDDDMRLDQDFTPEDLFALRQTQAQHAFTQEIVARSDNAARRYQWVTGVFGFHKKLSTQAPVTLKSAFFNDLFAGMPSLPYVPKMSVTDDCITDGTYDTPSWGVAAFHQSSVRIGGRVTATAGLRADYEQTSVEHRTGTSLPLRAVTQIPPVTRDYTQSILLEGGEERSYWQFSPKFTVNWQLRGNNRIYLSAARGYRSGGYNIQLFSDLVSDSLRTAAMADRTMTSHEDTIKRRPQIYYKPEYSWNYELGARVEMLRGRLQADLATFYIDSRNQQVTQLVLSGLGRVMRNAARSRSCGAEASLAGRFGNWTLQAGYGFTSSEFKEYSDWARIEIDGVLKDTLMDYSGKFVPFVPRHTVSAGVWKAFETNFTWVDRITLGVQYQGAGKIYFNEANDARQRYYSLLGGSADVEKGAFTLSLWARNVTGTDYKLFSFNNSINGRIFAQRGDPMQIGVTLKIKLP